jgi:hypothetical protein
MFHVWEAYSYGYTLDKFMGIPEGNAARNAEIIPIVIERAKGWLCGDH